MHCGDHGEFTASGRSRVIGNNALSVKAWYRLEYKEMVLYGSRFGAPYVSAFQFYLSRKPLSRTGQSLVPTHTENIIHLVFVIVWINL